MAGRPLKEMQERAELCFRGVSSDIRDECIRLAEKKSPSGAVTAAEKLAAARGVSRTQTLAIAKGTRWLALILRDHGTDAFRETIAQMTGQSATTSWRLASGEEVVDREDSHLHAGVAAVLPEIFSSLQSLGQEFINVQHEFGRVVGETTCVRTQPGDAIVYAQRINRQGHTRFVKNRSAEPCSVVTVWLRRKPDGRYEVATAYVGRTAPREPYDPKARRDESWPFWITHALVWGSEAVVPGTETDQCPW